MFSYSCSVNKRVFIPCGIDNGNETFHQILFTVHACMYIQSAIDLKAFAVQRMCNVCVCVCVCVSRCVSFVPRQHNPKQSVHVITTFTTRPKAQYLPSLSRVDKLDQLSGPHAHGPHRQLHLLLGARSLVN